MLRLIITFVWFWLYLFSFVWNLLPTDKSKPNTWSKKKKQNKNFNSKTDHYWDEVAQLTILQWSNCGLVRGVVGCVLITTVLKTCLHGTMPNAIKNLKCISLIYHFVLRWNGISHVTSHNPLSSVYYNWWVLLLAVHWTNNI